MSGRVGRSAPVPVSVVTGSVGVGKTSLIRRAMQEAGLGVRLAVIRMRFAVEIGYEEDTLDDRVEWFDAFETLEHLCLCCNPREEFEDVLGKLAERAHLFDRVVVETTGLADPACLWPLWALRETFVVESVVCLVDRKWFGLLPALSAGGLRSIEHEQVAFASVVGVVSSGSLDDLNIVNGIIPMIGSRVVTNEEHQLISAVLAPVSGSFSLQSILALNPDYFSEHTPYSRHQDNFMCASLVGVDRLSDDQHGKILAWISSLSWIRIKAQLHLKNGLCLRLEGVRGVFRQSQEVTEEAVSNKIALIGVTEILPDAFVLQKELERLHDIVLHPAVLYSAPAPVVDTTGQRLVLIAVGLIILFLPGDVDWKYRGWGLASLVLYFVLSKRRKWID
jgi:G3E family GTPase